MGNLEREIIMEGVGSGSGEEREVKGLSFQGCGW